MKNIPTLKISTYGQIKPLVRETYRKNMNREMPDYNIVFIPREKMLPGANDVTLSNFSKKGQETVVEQITFIGIDKDPAENIYVPLSISHELGHLDFNSRLVRDYRFHDVKFFEDMADITIETTANLYMIQMGFDMMQPMLKKSGVDMGRSEYEKETFENCNKPSSEKGMTLEEKQHMSHLRLALNINRCPYSFERKVETAYKYDCMFFMMQNQIKGKT
jgi:hypothetical protein